MYTPVIALPLFCAVFGSVAVGAYVWARGPASRARPDVRAFFAIIVGASLWSGGYALQLFSPTQSLGETAAGIALIGTVVLSVAWPVFVLVFTGNERWASRRWIAALSAVPALTVFVGFAMPDSGLLVLDTDTSAAVWGVAQYGVVLTAFAAYAVVTELVGFTLLVDGVRRSSGIRRRQHLAVLLAGLLPIAASGVPLLAPGLLPYNPTPVVFAVFVPILAWTITRYRLFELVPVARKQVLEGLSDPVVAFDMRADVAYANASMRALLDRGDVVGRPIDEVFGDWPEMTEEVVTAEETVEFHVDRDGEKRYFDGRSGSLESADGRTLGHVVVLREVTDRVRYETRFRTLIERSSSLLAILDEDWRVTYMSPAFETALGYDVDASVGRNAVELAHPEDREEVRAAFERARSESESGDVRVEYRVRREDATWRYVESIATDMFDVPFIDGLVVASHDVTERKRGEQRQRVLNRVLRHDLGNDINAVLGYLELLSDHVDPEGAPYLDIVSSRGEEIVSLSRKAAMVDRIFTGDGGTRRQVDVAPLLRDLVAKFETEVPELTVEASIPEECRVVADDLVGSAFDNLMENAIEHNTSESPHLYVAVRPHTVDGREYAEIRIGDDGPFIPENEVRVIETGTETSLEHASGLGLWLISWIVHASGGDLSVGRREPRGNEISVRLAAAEQVAEPGATR